MKNHKESGLVVKSPASIDDADFIVRCVLGQKEEREQLARICLDEVRKIVAFGYGGHPDMEDVAQKVLVTVFKDLKHLRNPASFRLWMYRITYNTIYRHSAYARRLKSLFMSDEFIDTRPSMQNETPESTAIRQDLFRKVQALLEKIKYKKRMAVVLSLISGYVDSEIATIMACSTETAKKRVQAGKRELFGALRKDTQLRRLFEEAVP